MGAFEAEFARAVAAPYALALSFATAALHLALILEVCGRYGIPVIGNAAEALGGKYHNGSPGTFITALSCFG